MGVTTTVATTAAKESAKKIASGFRSLISNIGKSKPSVKPATVLDETPSPNQYDLFTGQLPVTPAPAAAADAAAEASRLAAARARFFGSPGRTTATIIGGAALEPLAERALVGGNSLYGKYRSFVKGEDTGGEQSTLDLSQIYDPRKAADLAFAQQEADILGRSPNAQAELDRLARFSGMLPGGGGGAGAPRGGNVYGAQAQAGLDAAAAGTGTSTSGLTPVAGAISSSADNIRAQGGNLNDYIGFMEKAAAAAGVKMNAETRMKLATLATNNWAQSQNAIAKQLQEARDAQRQTALKLGTIPPFIPDKSQISQAEAMRKAGGNQFPVEVYLNQMALNYYRNLGAQG